MTNTTVYTVASHPGHRVIKALVEKGFTGITVTSGGRGARVRGWILECDQVPYRKLGHTVERAIQSVKELKNPGLTGPGQQS